MSGPQQAVQRFGPLVEPAGTTFRLWAPDLGSAQLIIEGSQPAEMQRSADGFLTLTGSSR